jgi:hypothetical protein
VKIRIGFSSGGCCSVADVLDRILDFRGEVPVNKWFFVDVNSVNESAIESVAGSVAMRAAQMM